MAEVERQIESTRSNVAARIAVQYHEALNREQMLKKAVADTKADWDRINSKSFEYQQLKQEADANKALYDELIKKIQESDINSGFQNNNIRIADIARPAQHHVFPNVKLNLLLAFLSSTLLAIGAALLYDSLNTTLRNPTETSRFLGIDVIGTMPVDRLSAQPPIGAGPVSTAVIVPQESHKGNRKDHYRSTSDFEEAVRTIRNTILLSDFEGRLRSIVLTSAAPGEGKTTIAAHLAIANADRGKKTLLVDGDLRRPSIHAKFGLTPDAGLSNVLTGDRTWQDVILPVTGRPNLTILPAGAGSHRAADLIGPRLASLLDDFAKEYDLVILDSPPLLGFAECLQMATAADGVLIISQAGKTERKAVAEVVSVLNRLHANIIGVVLNQVSQNTSADALFHYGYYGHEHYQKSE
jgi:capsular exopolysaccharide synthesis family protein